MTRDQRLTVLLSVMRTRGAHWLEDHPEEAPRTWVDHLVGGFATLFGSPAPPGDAALEGQGILARGWAQACVRTADQLALERGLELRTYTRDELPWWEATLALAYGPRRRAEGPRPSEDTP